MQRRIQIFWEQCRKDIMGCWLALTDRSEITFEWPENCPIEVRELVGSEDFDAQNSKFMMPFFWRKEAIPATRSWGIVVFAIEWSFGIVFSLLNSLHYTTTFFISDNVTIAPLICFITFLQLSIFFSEKILFLIAVVEKRARLLKQHMIFQYVTCTFLLLNATVTFAADAGRYSEEYLYAVSNPILIRCAAVISVIFIFVELYLRLMTKAIFTLISETQRFRVVLHNAKWRYRKRVYFSYCSIMQKSLNCAPKSQNNSKGEDNANTAATNNKQNQEKVTESFAKQKAVIDESCQTISTAIPLGRRKRTEFHKRHRYSKFRLRRPTRTSWSRSNPKFARPRQANSTRGTQLHIGLRLNSGSIQNLLDGSSSDVTVPLIISAQHF